jgi:hypothetical protein
VRVLRPRIEIAAVAEGTVDFGHTTPAQSTCERSATHLTAGVYAVQLYMSVCAPMSTLGTVHSANRYHWYLP